MKQQKSNPYISDKCDGCGIVIGTDPFVVKAFFFKGEYHYRTVHTWEACTKAILKKIAEGS